MISVIVPLYNNAQFLDRLIAQLINQTYKDFEVLFIDDGSTDSTKEIINKIDHNQMNYRYVYQKNQGAAQARNFGMASAQGEYIMFVDADDNIKADFIEYGSQLIEDSDLGIMGLEMVDAKSGNVIAQHQWENRYYSFNEFLNHFSELFNSELLYPVYNKIYRTNIIRENHLSFPKLRMGEDFRFNLQYFDFIQSVSLGENIYYDYMIYQSGTATTSFHGDEFDCSYKNHHQTIDFLTKHHIYDSKLINLHWAMILSYRFTDVLKLKKEKSEKYSFARKQFLEIVDIFKSEKLVKINLLPNKRKIKYFVMASVLNRLFI